MANRQQFQGDDQPPFAVGGVFGLRSFGLSAVGGEQDTMPETKKPGRVRGLICGPSVSAYVYGAGENIAGCQRSSMTTLNHRSMSYEVPITPAHRPGTSDCTCGFYAYWNGLNDYYHAYNVAAVVMGYGRVTYGTDGFKAEKLRVVAMVNPYLRLDGDRQKFVVSLDEFIADGRIPDPRKPRGKADRYSFFWAKKIPTIASIVMFLVGITVLLGLAGVLGPLVWLFMPVEMYGIHAFITGMTGRAAIRRRYAAAEMQIALIEQIRSKKGGGTDIPPWYYDEVAKNYPDVKWYPDTATMVEAHPLTTYEELPGVRAVERKKQKNPSKKEDA